MTGYDPQTNKIKISRVEMGEGAKGGGWVVKQNTRKTAVIWKKWKIRTVGCPFENLTAGHL